MSLLARSHVHSSNRRAKIRTTLEHKPVFRSVLENPFQICWPSVAVNLQNIALARLVATLENVPPRTRASGKLSHHSGGPPQQENDDITEDTESDAPIHLVIGVNAITRTLEWQLRLIRKHVVLDNLSPDDDHSLSRPAQSPIAIVFVCCADVDPTALIEHIPYLVAGCNSPRNVTQPIKLVPLPKGSEQTISQILGVRRAAALAFRRGSPSLEVFQDILDSIPIVSTPWLYPSGTQDTPQFVPTHIKQLRTTAPKDMKVAREQRAKARVAARKNMSSSYKSVRRKPRLTLSAGSGVA